MNNIIRGLGDTLVKYPVAVSACLGWDSEFVFNKIPEENIPLPCYQLKEITQLLKKGSACRDCLIKHLMKASPYAICHFIFWKHDENWKYHSVLCPVKITSVFPRSLGKSYAQSLGRNSEEFIYNPGVKSMPALSHWL